MGRYSNSQSTLLLERTVHLRLQFACVFERTSFWRRCRGTKRLILFNTTINENYFDLELYFYLTNVCRSLLCFCFIGVCQGRVVKAYYHSIQRLNEHSGHWERSTRTCHLNSQWPTNHRLRNTRETLTSYKPRTGNNFGMKGSNRRMSLEPFETTWGL